MRLGGLITLVALGAMASPASAATHQVTIANNAFVAQDTGTSDLTVFQGDTVTWTWAGPDTNHSTTTDSGGETTWDSDPGNPSPNHAVGDKFSWNLPDVGTYTYFCKVHSFMTGHITVVRKANDPNPPPVDTAGPRFGTPRVNVKRRRVSFDLDEPAQVRAKLRGRTRHNKTVNFAGVASPGELTDVEISSATSTTLAGDELLLARLG